MVAVEQVHSARHTVAVDAPPEAAYRVIADVGAWPHLFPPTVHAERLAGDDAQERIQIWTLANGEVRTRTSRRRLDPGACRVAFRQESSPPPVASMGGAWSMQPAPDGGTVLVLDHDFTA